MPRRKSRFISPQKGNRVDVVTLFLDIGADVNANAKKKSPLMAAAGSNAAEAAKLLIERGAVVDARGNSGRSALHAAAINGSADGARVLLEHGADIHAGDEQGITPFQFASAYRHRHGSNRLYRLMMTASGRPVKAGFDCDQADGAVEELVCADLDLAAMDAEMHRYYRKLEDSLVGQAGEKLRAYQQRWLKEDRNACVFSRGHYPQEEAFHEARNCLKAAYNERVESLKMSLAAHGLSLPGSSKP